ncbi:DNA-binding response regulator [Pseudorhodobacter sp. E13]|uniref:response regulator transcription factor n=1 Tax=Pseudorhodobacter sp. E13 TaxID=2487931 RepID=UPI000F8F5F23|nr:response regulator transcription factor [Pseudorhodobacter sp. E13]RUS59930.1 DNA-binding response regulator [Pseudorhodobacter sp. E13]
MKILVTDDHDLVRETIAAFLLAEGVEVADTAATLPEALKTMAETRYDLVLLDHDMPSMFGLTGLVQAIEAGAGTPVALMSGSTSRELAEAALEAGAIGFVPKKMASRAMVAAVKLMAKGDTFAPIGLLQSDVAPGAPLAMLTRRETSVLRGICEGKSNKEIARDLDLQEVTVKLHAKTLSRKLDAKNRTHAAMIARNGGML